jgi:Domain of unknown function (DUF1707)
VSAVTHPGLRASDDDRRRVVDELELHTADGRLTLDEFSERVRLVYSAATHADLARVTHDLPAVTPQPLASPSRGEPRQLLIAMVLAIVTIAVLGMLLAITK